MPFGNFEEKLLSFLDSLPDSENLDLIAPTTENSPKKADYLLNGRMVVCEVKTIKKDAWEKFNSFNDDLKERKEYPEFYGKRDINSILETFPDKEQIKERLYKLATNRVANSFKKANKQIKATKDHFGISQAKGVIVVLNYIDELLEPIHIAHCVQTLLRRKKRDGGQSFSSIHAVWILSPTHVAPIKETKAYPAIVLLNDVCDGVDHYTDHYMDWLQKAFSSYLGLPLIRAESDVIEHLIPRSHREKEERTKITRQEAWQRGYRRNRYMARLSDEQYLLHGKDIFKQMTPHFLKDYPSLPTHIVHRLMEMWSHFLEEMNMRNMDARAFQPYVKEVMDELEVPRDEVENTDIPYENLD